MPRNLLLEKEDFDSMPPTSRESESDADGTTPFGDLESYDFMDKIHRDMAKDNALYELRPIQKILSLDDLESSIVLENTAFDNPDHRCTREKVRQNLFY